MPFAKGDLVKVKSGYLPGVCQYAGVPNYWTITVYFDSGGCLVRRGRYEFFRSAGEIEHLSDHEKRLYLSGNEV